MDDLISRQAAIDALMKRDKELRNINWYDKPFAEGECRGIDYALEIVNALPSAQPERSGGEWIYQTKFSRIECDQCGKVFRNSFAPKNFCPNCGADMRPRKEEQDG